MQQGTSQLSEHVQYILDNFLIEHSTGQLIIDFHGEFSPTCDQEMKFKIEDLKKYLVENQPIYMQDFKVPAYDQCPDEFFWFEALEKLKHWQIEGFLNHHHSAEHGRGERGG